MKWIVGFAALAWGAIVWLAYHLAELRIPICHFETACLMRATATRDATLVYGLSFGLVGAVLLALAWRAQLQRLNRIDPAPREAMREQPRKLR